MTTGQALKRSTKHEPLSDELEPAPRYLCLRCGKTFTSSGHLKRHSLTHSGVKNHPCPFPGCSVRCSRQDNLQQQ
ncbi:hypothetical protein C8R45DRAFT_813827 [Mycena sanguinolenta]|nr:hypothetical protein C8R45DRAFT_813827 [Mycena sanguinolenta]